MEKLIKSKSFWLSFAFTALVIFTALLNFYRISTSSTDILIIPKSSLAASQFDVIMANFEKIPRTFSFYRRIISENPSLMNLKIAELPADKIQKFWMGKIETERLGKSGILRLSVSDKNRFQSEALAGQAQKTFIASSGFYYDINEDIDVRILNNLITEEKTGVPIVVILLESAVISFALVFLVFYAIGYLFPDRKKISFGKNWLKFGGVSGPKKANKSVPEVESNWREEDEPYEFFTKKAPAPNNLPTIEKKEILNSKQEGIEIVAREATPEEVKERLNKLLSGI